MRERNNEASKRCRLKRRMKAVSMENQSSMLNMANKMLKLRIRRLENVHAALKEGIILYMYLKLASNTIT